MTLRTLNYGNYGIFLIMGNAGFCPSTVCPPPLQVGFKARGLEFQLWSSLGFMWEFPTLRGYLRVPLKGYYKGTTRVPLKGSIRV